MINIGGGNNLTNLYIGNNKVKEVYDGNKKIFPKEPEKIYLIQNGALVMPLQDINQIIVGESTKRVAQDGYPQYYREWDTKLFYHQGDNKGDFSIQYSTSSGGYLRICCFTGNYGLGFKDITCPDFPLSSCDIGINYKLGILYKGKWRKIVGTFSRDGFTSYYLYTLHRSSPNSYTGRALANTYATLNYMDSSTQPYLSMNLPSGSIEMDYFFSGATFKYDTNKNNVYSNYVSFNMNFNDLYFYY